MYKEKQSNRKKECRRLHAQSSCGVFADTFELNALLVPHDVTIHHVEIGLKRKLSAVFLQRILELKKKTSHQSNRVVRLYPY